ncbi:UNVERIFIED_CONTAM: hypothetical protein Sradi_6531000 [Sesamum radiatum]|uniref:Uncharacterized protein n=1 Tax=Sesamum radiatum TaxID=300843 RepID=A0AAW2JVQ7_SESRA
MPSLASYFGVSTSDGVATRAGASIATCSRIAVKTICWIAPNRVGDNFAIEVSKKVLRYGGSAMVPTARGEGALVLEELGGSSTN